MRSLNKYVSFKYQRSLMKSEIYLLDQEIKKYNNKLRERQKFCHPDKVSNFDFKFV